MPKTPPEAQHDSPDPAQQIWLAGLGAFSQAQKKGSEALQKMLQDGLDLQKKAQQTAEQKIADATEKMTAMAQGLAKGQVPTPTKPDQNPAWGSLETLFEQRVVQALLRQGWASPERIRGLEQRIEALEAQMGKKQSSTPPPKAVRPRKPRNG